MAWRINLCRIKFEYSNLCSNATWTSTSSIYEVNNKCVSRIVLFNFVICLLKSFGERDCGDIDIAV